MKHSIIHVQEYYEKISTFGQHLADTITQFMGSWKFIILQSLLIIIWMIMNVVAFVHHWDPYPWILLNLIFSIQAAYSAPLIMMSQNRQDIKDRIRSENDYRVDVKAEEEIREVQMKLNSVSEKLNMALDHLEQMEDRTYKLVQQQTKMMELIMQQLKFHDSDMK